MSGAEVQVVFTKWGGGQHWESVGRVLGTDACGTWVGADRGRRFRRPGHDLVIPYSTVMLVPADAGYVAAFNERLDGPDLAGCSTYVDITTVPQWRDDVVTMVDLDLDVVQRWDGDVSVHDEDEFAEHQIALGYPPELVVAAERSCAEVVAALRAGRPPFDGRAATWLERLHALL
ncbi:MAG: DUF402 domain-containing protein [Nocardioidaceae bacterium]